MCVDKTNGISEPNAGFRGGEGSAGNEIGCSGGEIGGKTWIGIGLKAGDWVFGYELAMKMRQDLEKTF